MPGRNTFEAKRGANRWQTIIKVLFPLALPNVVNSGRLLFGRRPFEQYLCRNQFEFAWHEDEVVDAGQPVAPLRQYAA